MNEPVERRPDTDADLVAEAKAGKAGAFEKLYDRYWRWVMKITLSGLADETEAEDAAIETFADVARGLPRFRGESSFTTWLSRCAMNRVRHHQRKRRTEPWFVPVSEADAPSATLEEEHELRAEVEALMSDVRKLPDVLARAFTLRKLEELELAEVAKILGVSNATAGMRITRAMAALREMRETRRRMSDVRCQMRDVRSPHADFTTKTPREPGPNVSHEGTKDTKRSGERTAKTPWRGLG